MPVFPSSLSQNPSPTEDSQDRKQKVQSLMVQILQVFKELLPSNYLSQVVGPNYTIQFQAIAEQIAEFQVSAQEIFGDKANDVIRPEYLYQILGSTVFLNTEQNGYPKLSGDKSYRDFLTQMVILLLQGATKVTIEQGLALLVKNGTVFTIIENAIMKRKQGLVSNRDQFTFEINVVNSSTSFPSNPFVLEDNVRLVLQALKPAHMLYTYRHLLQEAFGQLFEDTVSVGLDTKYYDDTRKWCCGALQITGTEGETLSQRNLFQDLTRDFSSMQPYAKLTITSGPNSINASLIDAGTKGSFTVKQVLGFHGGDDSTARAYTTSPTGLSGSATVSGDTLTDTTQDFGSCVEGEVLTFSEGPNLGSYRLKTLLGNDGGPIGLVTGPATQVRVAKSVLELRERMSTITTGQAYRVSVHRLGIQEPHFVSMEDASSQFYV